MTENPTLDSALSASGAADWGGVPFSALVSQMSPEAQEKAEKLCPGAAAVLVAAFPYFAGDAPGNLSLYARGEDYHLVLTRRLTAACEALALQWPGYRFVPGADNSPLPERAAAQLAGVGLLGKHGLTILPPYGSYVFLGTILTDCPLPLSPAMPAPDCISCGKCLAACPTGALCGDAFFEGRCLSHLTQKKGVLTDWEAQAVASHPYAWGCDLCQRACPYNAQPQKTGLPELSTSLIASLTPALLNGLTNRAFRGVYGSRAFAWRGPAVLRRNLALQSGEGGQKQE